MYIHIYIYLCKYKISFQNIYPVWISNIKNNWEFVLAAWLLKKPIKHNKEYKGFFFPKTKGKR